MSHGYWYEDVGGVFDGLAIIFSDVPVGNTSVKVTYSNFIHNIIIGKNYSVRIGCLVTTTFNNECTYNAPWDILTISNSTISDNGESVTTDNGFNSYITPNQYYYPIVHINTSTIESINLRIHLDHLNCIQSYIEIRNPFIISETQVKKHWNSFYNLLNSISYFGSIL